MSYQTDYAKTEKGKACYARYRSKPDVKKRLRKQATERARSEPYKERQRAWLNTEGGRESNAESQRKWLQTPGGRAYTIRRNALRRGGPEFAEVSVRFHRKENPCNDCGKVYEPKHQVDHIHPLAAGGTHGEFNLQLLCVDCHKKKTKIDQEFIRLMK